MSDRDFLIAATCASTAVVLAALRGEALRGYSVCV